MITPTFDHSYGNGRHNLFGFGCGDFSCGSRFDNGGAGYWLFDGFGYGILDGAGNDHFSCSGAGMSDGCGSEHCVGYGLTFGDGKYFSD